MTCFHTDFNRAVQHAFLLSTARRNSGMSLGFTAGCLSDEIPAIPHRIYSGIARACPPRRSCVPSTAPQIAYSAAISACEKGQQWTLTLWLLDEMAELQVAKDLITYNAAISACRQGQQWQRALVLLGDMAVAKIEKSFLTFYVAIGACEKGQQRKVAVVLLAQLAAALEHFLEVT